MKNQVLSVKQMQELIALGINVSAASMCWLGWSDGDDVYPYNSTFRDVFENHKDTLPKVITPTFTLQDILEIVRKQTFTEGGLTLTEGYENKWICCFTYQTFYDGDYTEHEQFGDTSLEAAFNMLKWCKQNNYI